MSRKDSQLPRPGTDFPLALSPFLKDVGRGVRRARSLSRAEAAEAGGIILRGDASEAQIGAFFQAMRLKGETSEELAGLADAIRSSCGLGETETIPHRIELGLAYDGRLRGFHVMPFAARLAADLGVQTFFPGTRALGPKYGINAIEVLEATGLARAGDLAAALAGLEETGIGACDQAAYCPELAALQNVRNEVFLRGPFASSEKLLNLSGASTLLTSVVHTPYVTSISGALSLLLQSQPEARGWVLQAPEGHLDISPGRKTSAWRVPTEPGDTPEEVILDATQGPSATRGGTAAGRGLASPPDPPDTDPLQRSDRTRWIEANVRWGEEILAGKEERGRAAMISSTALLLWLGAKTSSYEEGVGLAEKALSDSGA